MYCPVMVCSAEWLCCSLFSETQKKKQNQDDSDEYDEDDEPGPSFQPPAAGQTPAGYMPPITQPGMPPGAGVTGLQPVSYSGEKLGIKLIMLWLFRFRNRDLRICLSVADVEPYLLDMFPIHCSGRSSF